MREKDRDMVVMLNKYEYSTPEVKGLRELQVRLRLRVCVCACVRACVGVGVGGWVGGCVCMHACVLNLF